MHTYMTNTYIHIYCKFSQQQQCKDTCIHIRFICMHIQKYLFKAQNTVNFFFLQTLLLQQRQSSKYACINIFICIQNLANFKWVCLYVYIPLPQFWQVESNMHGHTIHRHAYLFLSQLYEQITTQQQIRKRFICMHTKLYQVRRNLYAYSKCIYVCLCMQVLVPTCVNKHTHTHAYKILSICRTQALKQNTNVSVSK
eukprot:TRINITY_DN7909_c0_g1_i5.p2 TRINITY_DN7909_c0_g1~~TRINITY_DN7909_c0_g1_i5.p2  ORF type:complete len:197 (-),score=-23.13 TRINITY_DN7909_c0_g1_i5:442-1032(-)